MQVSHFGSTMPQTVRQPAFQGRSSAKGAGPMDYSEEPLTQEQVKAVNSKTKQYMKDGALFTAGSCMALPLGPQLAATIGWVWSDHTLEKDISRSWKDMKAQQRTELIKKTLVDDVVEQTVADKVNATNGKALKDKGYLGLELVPQAHYNRRPDSIKNEDGAARTIVKTMKDFYVDLYEVTVGKSIFKLKQAYNSSENPDVKLYWNAKAKTSEQTRQDIKGLLAAEGIKANVELVEANQPATVGENSVFKPVDETLELK